MKHFKPKLHILLEELFQFSLITYLILLLAETLQTGFVSYFFNLNILLGVVLVSGILMVLTHNEQLDAHRTHHKITTVDLQYVLLLALGGGLLVYYKTQALGQIAKLIAILTGGIIVLLSLLVLIDDKK